MKKNDRCRMFADSLAVVAVLFLAASPGFAQLSMTHSTFEPGAVVTDGLPGGLNMRATVGQSDAAPQLGDGATLFMESGFYFSELDEVLAIRLLEFYAQTAGPGHIIEIVWETSMEIDNAGFHLYRAVRNEAGYFLRSERITASLIPAEGPGSGARYTFIDPRPFAEGEERAYFLEDIDLFGARSQHGPVLALRLDERGSTRVADWQMYE